jgi:UDP-glucose 4-epimerase
VKALVTGGAGFIGSNICRKLVALGWFVRVVDNLSSGKEANLADIRDKVEFIHADMGDPAVAATAMKGIDVVFHHGAQVSVPASVEDPLTTHRNCVDATFTLLMAAREAKVRRFVYAASSAAYGDDPAQLKVETMLPRPISPYAIGKLAGEYYCSVFFKVYGLETISLRYFNVFGPRQDPKSQYAAAIPAFVTMMLNNKQPTIYGDGEQTRDFTYIDNVVHANLLAANASHASGEVINIASGTSVTVNETITLIAKLLGKSPKPTYTSERAGDVKYSSADISLAKKIIGFEPVVSFHDGMANVIEWYRRQVVG